MYPSPGPEYRHQSPSARNAHFGSAPQFALGQMGSGLMRSHSPHQATGGFYMGGQGGQYYYTTSQGGSPFVAPPNYEVAVAPNQTSGAVPVPTTNIGGMGLVDTTGVLGTPIQLTSLTPQSTPLSPKEILVTPRGKTEATSEQQQQHEVEIKSLKNTIDEITQTNKQLKDELQKLQDNNDRATIIAQRLTAENATLKETITELESRQPRGMHESTADLQVELEQKDAALAKAAQQIHKNSAHTRYLTLTAELAGFLRERKTFFASSQVLLQHPITRGDPGALLNEYHLNKNRTWPEKQQQLNELYEVASQLKEFGMNEDMEVDELRMEWNDVEHLDQQYIETVQHEQEKASENQQMKQNFAALCEQHLAALNSLQVELFTVSQGGQLVDVGSKIREHMEQSELLDFGHLQTLAQELMPDEDVSSLLIEVSQHHINVHISSFEVLYHLLIEESTGGASKGNNNLPPGSITTGSALLQKVAELQDWLGQIGLFLRDVEDLLHLPTDNESMDTVKPYLAQCQQQRKVLSTMLHPLPLISNMIKYAEITTGNCDMLRVSLLNDVNWKWADLINRKKQAAYTRQQDFDSALQNINSYVSCVNEHTDRAAAKECIWDEVRNQLVEMKAIIETSGRSNTSLAGF